MQHLDEGTIHAWLDGALDPGESSRVERHAAECATCSEAVAEARGMIAGASRIVSSLDVVPGSVIPRSSSTAAPRGWLWRGLRLTPARAALAATLLLAVGTMLTVQHSPTPGALSEPPTTVFDAKAPTEVKSTTGNAAPAPIASAAAAQPAAPKASAEPARAVSATAGAAADKKASAVADVTSGAAGAAPVVVAGGTARGSVVPVMPPPSSEVHEKIAAKPPATLQLSGVVTTSAAAVRAADSIRFDSLKERRTTMADSVAAPIGTRQFAAARAGAARGASGFADAMTNQASECYRVTSDSATVSAAVFLPRLFSLQQNAGTPPQNVVRAVAPNGRIDSAIAGARWERLTPTTTRLYLTSAASASTLTLHFADGRVAGQLSTSGGQRDINLTRWSCRP